jgi:3-phytase
MPSLILFLVLFFFAAPRVVEMTPAVATQPVGNDADDPALWLHPSHPERSLVLGTNKAAAPDGALVVFDLRGEVVQRVAGLDRPNNVDVRGSVAALTERYRRQVVVFRVGENGVTRLGEFPVFAGQEGNAGAPMGIALYQRPRDWALFAIVGRKTGPAQGYLWQYRLETGGGALRAVKVREFGNFSGTGEIEAIAVDDELGIVYYADEECCIRKWRADPDHPQAGEEIGVFGRDGFRGNREGIAIYREAGGEGYIVCTDQIPHGSEYRVFRRRGDQAAPVAVLRGGADSTDGIEVTSAALGARFPRGALIAMHSAGRNFLIFPWPLARE